MAGYYGSFVVPEALATVEDFARWTRKAAPENTFELLRACTTMVLDVVDGYYDVDPATGLATDPDILGAMRDATCIQAAAWAALGIDPATGGVLVSGVKKSKKIGTASFELADADASAAARAEAYENLVPLAVRKLEQQNLIGNAPWMFG